MKYGIVRSHHAIPIHNHRLIHPLHVLERSVAELDDVRVVEMSVGREECVLWVKSEVHNIAFGANIAFPKWVCKSLQTLQRFAEAILSAYLCIKLGGVMQRLAEEFHKLLVAGSNRRPS